MKKTVPAFTLVELLVVVSIIALLIALLLPAVQAAREAARRTQCATNLRQLGQSLHSYHSVCQVFPPGGMSDNGLGYLVMLLPYLEQQSLYDKFTFTAGAYNNAGKLDNALYPLPIVLCPSCPVIRTVLSDHSENWPKAVSGVATYTTHYNGIMGPKGINPTTGTAYRDDGTAAMGFGADSTQGVLYKNSSVSLDDIPDGASNTFAVGEISWIGYNKYRTWIRGSTNGGGTMGTCKNVMEPINAGLPYGCFNDGAFGSEHPGGAHFLFCDSAVRFVAEGVDHAVYLATASRNGGEKETCP